MSDSKIEIGLVEFRHGRGCTLGQPYGECGYYCGYKAIKTFNKSNILELNKFLRKLSFEIVEYKEPFSFRGL